MNIDRVSRIASTSSLSLACLGLLALAGCGDDAAAGAGSGYYDSDTEGTGTETGTETDTDDGTSTGVDTCANGVQDADETDVDCGGSCENKCGSGQGCGGNEDCEDGTVCTDAGVCGQDAGGNCQDGQQNQDETDVDCGGSCPDPCGDGQGCGRNEDCTSGVCEDDVCQAPACDDGIQNGDETDVDCGGTCPGCPDGGACVDPQDCMSGVCEAQMCVPPTCRDGVQNGDETDVDCGGACGSTCETGDMCLQGPDCISGSCDGDDLVCLDPTCDDAVQNGDETDVDCGGSCGPTCDTGEGCLASSDCISLVCDLVTETCAAPTCDDGVQNGDETDVDCGSSCGMTCDEGQMCLVDDDCISGSCDDGSLTCDPNVSVIAAPACSDYSGAPVQLTAAASGGTGNYTYSWTPAAGLDDPTSQTPLASPTGFETYTVTVDDGVNTAQDTVTVVDNSPFDLQGNCTLYTAQFLPNSQPASITYSSGGTVACEEGNNNFGLHLCEGVSFEQTELVGQFTVTDDLGDDDWIGLVWGAQDNSTFYSLQWKAANQYVNAFDCTSPGGILVKRVDAPDFASLTGPDLYCNDNTLQSSVLVTPAESTTEPWVEGETYQISIAFTDTGSDITVERTSDDSIVTSFTVDDTNYTSGFFGSTTLSQGNACVGPLFASCI